MCACEYVIIMITVEELAKVVDGMMVLSGRVGEKTAERAERNKDISKREMRKVSEMRKL